MSLPQGHNDSQFMLIGFTIARMAVLMRIAITVTTCKNIKKS